MKPFKEVAGDAGNTVDQKQEELGTNQVETETPTEPSNPEVPNRSHAVNSQTAPLSPQRPTNPRTSRGKRRSSYNPVRHGIFAKCILRNSVLRESAADYRRLLESFRESFRPVGGIEELLVEKLAMLAWQEARAVRADAAVVMRQTEYVRQSRRDRLIADSEGLPLDVTVTMEGIAYSRDNHYLLGKAVKSLESLQRAIEKRGFDVTVDEGLLKAVYGKRTFREGVLLKYHCFSEQIQKTTDETERKNIQNIFLQILKKEIEHLRDKVAAIQARDEKMVSIEEETLSIPMGMELDRLLRYRTYLERSFDRTLAQLERLQRLRAGQPVPPTLKVDVTSD